MFQFMIPKEIEFKKDLKEIIIIFQFTIEMLVTEMI